jgi:TrmH family RNA methyltransferase
MVLEPHFKQFERLSKAKVKFIKSLRLKKYRLQENSFVLEGEKSVSLLLASPYQVTTLVATPHFLNAYAHLLQGRPIEVFSVHEAIIKDLSNLEENHTALAIAPMRPSVAWEILPRQYGLVLDDIQNPGNLGTIIRVADWYGLAGIICSPTTVDLYNPKVLQASMGSFLHVQVHYTDLTSYLAKAQVPIIGTFTSGESLHDPSTVYPAEGLIVIGNEARGISPQLLPYIQQRLHIPRYGQAESLNAALAAAIVCDNLKRVFHTR